MSYIALVIQSTIACFVCRLLLVWDRVFLTLLRISVRFLHLLSLSFLTLHACKWLEVDWENLGLCHGVIEFIAGMHAIHVAYQSE